MKKLQILFLKELREERGWILVMFGIGTLIYFYIFLKQPGWEKGTATVVSILPFVAIPFMSMLRGYTRYMRKERNTEFFIFSLPVHEECIVLSKVLVLMIEIFSVTGFFLFAIMMIAVKDINGLKVPVDSFFIIWFGTGAGFSGIGIISMGSYLFSRLFRRFKGFLSFLFFVFSIFVYVRFFSFLEEGLKLRASYYIEGKEMFWSPFPGFGFFVYSLGVVFILAVVFKKLKEV